MTDDDDTKANRPTTDPGFRPLGGVPVSGSAPATLRTGVMAKPQKSPRVEKAAQEGRESGSAVAKTGARSGGGGAPRAPGAGKIPLSYQWAALWLLVGLGFGTLMMSSIQTCRLLRTMPDDLRRSQPSGLGGVVPSRTTPCPPDPAAWGNPSLDPYQLAELERTVEAARGERIQPGTERGINVARALILLGDSAVLRIAPVTGVTHLQELQRVIQEPIDHYRRAVEFYGRVGRYDLGLLQCSMVRMGLASERLSATFDASSRDPAITAVEPEYYPRSLRELAQVYREMAMQQHEVALQVSPEDPECTHRASEAYRRLSTP